MSIQTFFDPSFLDLNTSAIEQALAYSHSPVASSTTPSVSTEVPSPTGTGCSKGSSRRESSSPAPDTSATTGRKRIRPKVDLAPGQPPTARGNPRIRVFVACYQCRARKVRCDGAKPICCNCQKRPSEAEQCTYDSGPHRKGREKGTARARTTGQVATAKKPAKRKRSPQGDDGDRSHSATDVDVPVNEMPSGSVPAVSPVVSDDMVLESELLDFADAMAWGFDPLLQDAGASISMVQPEDVSITVTLPQRETPDESEEDQRLPSRPGSMFARDTWWDALLTFYATERGSGDGMQIVSLSQTERSAAMRGIMTDLKALLQSSPSWVSFLHLPRFFDSLFNPVRRHILQPSLLFSALALGALSQSSEVEKGREGRRKAQRLLDMAHSALEGSLATGWIDIGLAQAAALIVYFEMQPHPQQTLARSRSALLLLDSLVRLFSLPSVDDGVKPRGRSPFEALRRTARNNYFNPAVQMGFIPQPPYMNAQSGPTLPVDLTNSVPQPLLTGNLFNFNPVPSVPITHTHGQRGCNCLALSLGHNWPSVHNLAPSWRTTMMWPENLSEADFRREECRRLVWGSVMLIANLYAYAAATPDSALEIGPVFAREPEVFALMLPGEALAASGVPVDTDDMWTLSMRTMLLLHVCLRIRETPDLSPTDRAQLAVQAWIEVDDLEKRLERHTCELDTGFGFQAKEMMFNMRMLTSHEFQKFIPQVTTNGSTLFYRDKAESWLRYIEAIGDYMWRSLSIATRSPTQDHRKSLLLYWFMSNVRKALALWQRDPGLVYALTLSRTMAERAEYLMMFWPNIRVRELWQKHRLQLVEACLRAGIKPPSANIPRIPAA